MLSEILKNTSLWEVVMLLVVVYLLFRPDLINRITKFKIGDFELELSEMKKEIAKGNEMIIELETELENEKRQFEELLDSFDANVPLSNLKSIRQSIKAQARNLDEEEFLSKYLNESATPEELYAAAVGIREKRPVSLFPNLIDILDNLSKQEDLGGYRLNTIWTLTSAIHKILISIVRDGVKPIPSKEQLNKCKVMLKRLDNNPRVLADRPDKPMKGIKGPVKYSLDWLKKLESNVYKARLSN
ncbi:hypothetical protein [Flammeovirga sp. OC4]|uniref:hypothetical protein n=1 Tax=Flammeovirga sp. OC4 TaxID=1382345 RepID=UPI0012E05D3C|nr:hypothetical protein [Flammeovirga sp. OC4]